MLVPATDAWAQRIVPNRVGATEAIQDRKSSVGLIVESSFATETPFVRDVLFAPSEAQGLGQVGPTASGEFVTGRVSSYVAVPYIVTAAFVPIDLPLPDLYEFEWNHGLGDARAGVSVDLLRQRPGTTSAPITFTVSTDVLAPTGMSRFESAEIPLGNGFWNVSLGAGVSRTLGGSRLVFANGGYVHRPPRTFERGELRFREATLTPGSIRFARAGFGFVAGESIVNLQIERTWVGGVIDDRQVVVEPEFVLTRVGVQVAVNRDRGLGGSVFAGLEMNEGDVRLTATFALPLVRIVGVDF
jgi:hypothetical protein